MVCEQIFFDLHHSDTQFSLKMLTVFGPQKSPASFSRGASDVEPEIFAVSMSAKRVCADLKKGPQKTGVVRGLSTMKVYTLVYGV
jgi:hypothetical protein